MHTSSPFASSVFDFSHYLVSHSMQGLIIFHTGCSAQGLSPGPASRPQTLRCLLPGGPTHRSGVTGTGPDLQSPTVLNSRTVLGLALKSSVPGGASAPQNQDLVSL